MVKERDDMKLLYKKVALKEQAYADEREGMKGSLKKSLSSIKVIEIKA